MDIIIHNMILHLPCFVSIYWAALLLLNKKSNNRPQNIWMVLMFVLSACTFVWIMLFGGIDNYKLYYKLDIVDITLTLFIFPLLYLYFWALNTQKALTWKQYIWFLPGLILGGISAFLYLRMGEEQSIKYIQTVIENQDTYQFVPGTPQWLLYLVSLQIYYVVFFIQIIAVLSLSTLNVIRYRKGVQNFFSNLEGKSIENNRAVLIGLFIFLFIGLVAAFLWGASPEVYYSSKYVLMSLTGVCIFYMGYHVYKTKPISQHLLHTEGKLPTEEDEPLEEVNEAHRNKMLPLFNRLIDEEKKFLHSTLTLDDIAFELKTNRTYVSRIINEEFQCNFYEFINRKRVEFAKELMMENPHLTQEQIAEMSGFTHASTFSRTFKKQTGLTFRQWKNR
ncbi:AraC family transcriptional regulator [Bacteroides sp. 214]|uniref:helix-turn-helix domain-containing protein n=1 Tax=Bacteroides sp. 214 TaxID=2302935 RepID=UPI0013D3F1F4|nr:helix-turn-helix domain-containing protein [Bacteroides sp. 214]NDW12353.1 AraC family transcriptional regulator [Bacteroides sp. 214]